MRKKQTAVSHNSAESEVCSVDVGLKLEGIPALQLSDCVFTNVFACRHWLPHSIDHVSLDMVDQDPSDNVLDSSFPARLHIF